MGCGVKLHDELIIPLGELLGNKSVNSTCLEAIMHTREVILILLDELPVNPSHVTHNGLLIKQNCLIEVLLLLSVESIVQSSPSPGGIWIRLSS